MIDLAGQVKSLVTVQRAAEFYGYHPNRMGYICCPFHNEKTASLKLFPDGGWKCFGCGAGGSVIDFVMKLYDIPFRQAILRINTDFALGLTGDRPDPAARAAVLAARRREARRKAELERLEGKLWELAGEHQYWWEVRKHFCPTGEDMGAGYIHPLYAEAVKRQPYLEYLLDELEQTTEEVKTGRGREYVTAERYGAGGGRPAASPGQTA